MNLSMTRNANRECVGSIDNVIDYLNEILATDRPAIAALMANRVPCNEQLAEHPTVQVQPQHGGYHVGLLGIINGMFGVDDLSHGLITIVFEDGNLLKFARTDDCRD
jgi:hypothetical protein